MKRRQLLLSILLLTTLASCQSREQGKTRRGDYDLRVMTYNIRHGEGVDGVVDLERTAEVLSRNAPDLVALQEVDRQVARTGSVDQVRELARLTEMNPAFAKFMDLEGGVYGLAILSRFPIERSWSIELPPGQHEPRTALAVRVNVPQVGPVTFVCLHFDWLAEDFSRYAQAEALIAALSGVDTPVILAGDFNDTPNSRTMSRLREVYTNAEKPREDRRTFSSTDPQREIDFVLYKPARRFIAEVRVLDEPVASDHRPVIAKLRPQ